MKRNALEKIIRFTQQELSDEKTGHDFQHVSRVARLAETIIREDQLPVDSFVVAASAYLHDVIDDKVVQIRLKKCTCYYNPLSVQRRTLKKFYILFKICLFLKK